jgi:hypothetical protein
MEDEKRLPRIVKWAGIVALIAIPVVVLLKSRKSDRRNESSEAEDSNIFAGELEE